MSCVTSYTFPFPFPPFLPCTPERRRFCALLLALAFPLTLAASSPRGHIPKRDIIISSMSQSHLRIPQSFCQVSWTSPQGSKPSRNDHIVLSHLLGTTQPVYNLRLILVPRPQLEYTRLMDPPLSISPHHPLMLISTPICCLHFFSWTLVILQCFSLALKTFSSLYYHRPYRLLALVSYLPGSIAVPK
jgi:hypothetical protein